MASFHDAKYFKLNECIANEEFSISTKTNLKPAIILVVCGKNTAVPGVGADVPSEQRSQLTPIYLALLCKANDIIHIYIYNTGEWTLYL